MTINNNDALDLTIQEKLPLDMFKLVYYEASMVRKQQWSHGTPLNRLTVRHL